MKPDPAGGPETTPTRMPLGRASVRDRLARSASRPLTLGTRDRIRVETVEAIVGELMDYRGNKVFQVVTPVR